MYQQQQTEQTQVPLVSQALTRVWSLLRDYDFEFSELFTGLVAFWWGVSLLNPLWLSFHNNGSVYRLMDDIASENAWGAALFLLGAVQLTSLICEWWRVRRAAALLSCGLWGFMSYIVISNTPMAPISIFAPSFLFASAWAYLRMRFHRRRRGQNG